jgi:hypothetical protein
MGVQSIIMLKEFELWFKDNEIRLKNLNIKVDVVNPNTNYEKNSAYANIETSLNLAKVIVWDSGECDIEALNIETGENIVPYRYYVFDDKAELFLVLEELIKNIC